MVFIPMVPLFYTLINPSAYFEWFRWVPILSHQVLIKDLLLGGNATIISFVLLWSISLLAGVLLLWIVQKQLRKPKIVYGL
jgi:sodium transport system permease protein